jgi:prophage regulatory protein
MKNNEPEYKLIKKAEVLRMFCLSKSTLYLQITDGLMPPPFSIGSRAVAWYRHEIIAVIRARTAGKTDDEIRMRLA